MRKLLIAAFAALPLMAMVAAPKTVMLDVKNMTCEVCPITVKKSLEKVAGVSAVKGAAPDLKSMSQSARSRRVQHRALESLLYLAKHMDK